VLCLPVGCYYLSLSDLSSDADISIQFRLITAWCSSSALVSVTVTVTEALVLRPLLEDRGHITESVHILVPTDRMKQKCFQITTKRVRRSQQFQLCR